MVFVAAWVLMGAGYTVSGLNKLLSAPSWRDGSAMMLLLHNPLSRPGPLRDLMLQMPEWVMRPLTWFSAALDDVGGFWRVVSWGRVVPRPLRDRVYDFVARHRYGWFGRSEQCRLPTPRQRDQLLP